MHKHIGVNMHKVGESFLAAGLVLSSLGCATTGHGPADPNIHTFHMDTLAALASTNTTHYEGEGFDMLLSDQAGRLVSDTFQVDGATVACSFDEQTRTESYGTAAVVEFAGLGVTFMMNPGQLIEATGNTSIINNEVEGSPVVMHTEEGEVYLSHVYEPGQASNSVLETLYIEAKPDDREGILKVSSVRHLEATNPEKTQYVYAAIGMTAYSSTAEQEEFDRVQVSQITGNCAVV